MAETFLQKVGRVSDPKEMRSLATEWVHESFPEVETVSTETLQSWIENNPEELLILVSDPLHCLKATCLQLKTTCIGVLVTLLHFKMSACVRVHVCVCLRQSSLGRCNIFY